ncbi:MAG TPA: erythromycin esterase family protein [Thermoanaerobaculia bacterium]|nr:erythromycin esterase family protein [Thermoanaerobaculia bacterium]
MAWLSENAVRIRTVDPAKDDFADLEPLRETLKGVRVVLLGEQNHGDGTTFLAKTRLIRFLHEKMGFDVLAFESGLYECAKAWDALAADENAEQAVSRGVFRIWTESRELQPLIEYLGSRAQSERPLELAGVDCQLTGTAAKEFLAADLAAALSRIDPKLTEGDEWNRVSRVIAHLADGSWELGTTPLPSAAEQAAFARTLEHWRSLLAERDSTPAARPWSGAFWRQILASLRVNAEQTWRTDPANAAGNAAVFAMRDRQMGENLIWLAGERYPNHRIIVWAATFHNARRLATVETGDPKNDRLYEAVSPMGEVAWKKLGDELYSLGFTSYDGESASAFARSPNAIPAPGRGSIEDLFARAGLETAFVDFRKPPAGGQWLRSPLIAKLLGHVPMRADWTRVVDGVVFIRTMQRSSRKEGSAEPPPAPWVNVYHDDSVAFQVRRTRILTLDDGRYRVWLRWLFAAPRPWKSGEELSMVMNVDLDCRERRLRELVTVHKNRAGEIFDREERRPEDAPWKSFGANTGAASALDRVCEFVPRLIEEEKKR